MRELDDAVQAFLHVLRCGWPSVRIGLVESADWDESVLADWAQANWEMIVEAAVSRREQVVLEVYGDGADCNDHSSRVWRPDFLPSHAVFCRTARTDGIVRDQLTGEAIRMPSAGLRLFQFVALTQDGWYKAEPPFDHALLDSDQCEVVVNLTDVAFALVEIQTPGTG